MILIKAKYTQKRPLDVARDAWRDISRTAYRTVGLFWVATYLMAHFVSGAAAKYGYKFRSKAYRDRKDRLFAAGRPFNRRGGLPVIAGSSRPNVLTGYMMREIQSNVIVRGFPTRVSVHLIGPQYFTTRFHKKNQPNKGKELTTVLPAERSKLSQVLRGAFLKGLNQYRSQRVTE